LGAVLLLVLESLVLLLDDGVELVLELVSVLLGVVVLLEELGVVELGVVEDELGVVVVVEDELGGVMSVLSVPVRVERLQPDASVSAVAARPAALISFNFCRLMS
jgi:hypothetical protein